MEYTYKYPRPAVTADCVVITGGENLQVLLVERGDEPYKGCWALPGGFLDMDETTEQCAIRELEEETGLKVSEVHQVGTYSKVDRDPRGRTITVAYLVVVEQATEVKGQDDAAKAQWFPLTKLPKLAFDHDEIVNDAMKTYMRVDSDVPYEDFKKMDDDAKIDVMTATMSDVLFKKFPQVDASGFAMMMAATSQLFGNLAASLCEITKNAGKVVDLAMKMVCSDLVGASNRELLKKNKEEIELLKQKIQEIQLKIEEKNKVIKKLKSKQKKDIKGN